MITRREFARRTVLSFAGFYSMMILSGCNAITDFENWIPVALTSLAAIAKLLAPVISPPVAAAITLISTGFSAVLSALKNYQKGTGILSDVANAISDVEASFAGFFAALNVPSGLLATIEALGEILISTLEGFASQVIPVVAAAKSALVVSGHAVSTAPVKRSTKKFRSDWNSVCVQHNVPQAAI